jgi:hypothetical protein
MNSIVLRKSLHMWSISLRRPSLMLNLEKSCFLSTAPFGGGGGRGAGGRMDKKVIDGLSEADTFEKNSMND